mgnify:CR=1 FL=1
MPLIAPRHLLLLCSLTLLACKESATGLEDDTGSTGTTTAPDPSTTMPDTPTTTSDITTTAPGDEGPGTTSTTGGTDTGSDEAGSTMAVTECGNGIVEDDEACDDGLTGNDDSRFCTADCNLNVCGDGKLFVEWELCDEGAANSDDYGSLCAEDCKPGARCGDHKLQEEFETCDLGLENGGKNGDNQGILCDTSCRAQQLRGFITSEGFTGALDGLFGADLKCKAAATAAGLASPERFHAYLSTADVDAKDRFDKVVASLPYVLVTGKKFADNFPGLIAMGPLGEGISVTEYGSTLYETYVATNTAPGGVSFSPEENCLGWTSAKPDYTGRVGFSALPVDSPDAMLWQAEQWWTGVKSRQCDKAVFHLYCLEI